MHWGINTLILVIATLSGSATGGHPPEQRACTVPPMLKAAHAADDALARAAGTSTEATTLTNAPPAPTIPVAATALVSIAVTGVSTAASTSLPDGPAVIAVIVGVEQNPGCVGHGEQRDQDERTSGNLSVFAHLRQGAASVV